MQMLRERLVRALQLEQKTRQCDQYVMMAFQVRRLSCVYNVRHFLPWV